MGARLTDKLKKQIIADRVEGLSMRKIAAKYNISDWSVRKVVKEEGDLSQKLAQKKHENEMDIFAYMESRKGKVQQILDIGMDQLTDPSKWAKSSPQSIATAIGILIDKYTNLANLANNAGGNSELLQSLFDLEKRRQSDGD